MHRSFRAYQRHLVPRSSLSGARRAQTAVGSTAGPAYRAEAGASALAGDTSGQAAGARPVNVPELLQVFKVLAGVAAIYGGAYGLLRASYLPMERRIDEIKAELKGDRAELKAELKAYNAELREDIKALGDRMDRQMDRRARQWDRLDRQVESLRRELNSKLDQLMLLMVRQAGSDKERK